MDERRSQRLTEALREELDELIGYELEDPRVNLTTVVEVLVSPDGKRATIRVRPEGDSQQQADCVEALNGAKGFLKHELGLRLDMFRIPDLKFEADLSPELAAKAASLMQRVKRGRPKD
jgi:ribosome-binding factor A